MSRWIPLLGTTPSGKTLFVCSVCGRVTPAPTTECIEPPQFPTWDERSGRSCKEVEDEIRGPVLTTLFAAVVPRSSTVAKKVQGAELEEAVSCVRDDRVKLVSWLGNTVEMRSDVALRVQLQYILKEIEKR